MTTVRPADAVRVADVLRRRQPGLAAVLRRPPTARGFAPIETPAGREI